MKKHTGVSDERRILKPKIGMSGYFVFALFLLGIPVGLVILIEGLTGGSLDMVMAGLIVLTGGSLDMVMAGLIILAVSLYCILNSSFLSRGVRIEIMENGELHICHKNREVAADLLRDGKGGFNFKNACEIHECIRYADGSAISSSARSHIAWHLRTVLQTNGLLSSDIRETVVDEKEQEINMVYDTGKLYGWRTPDGEELKVAKGLMMNDAKSSVRTGGVMNVFLVVFSTVSFYGAWNMLLYLMDPSTRDGMRDTVLMAVLFAVLLITGILLAKMAFGSFRDKTGELQREAIRENNIRINDVEIHEVITLRGVGEGIDGHRVKVKDMTGTYCNENIEFVCLNGYKKTKALLMEVPVGEEVRKIVIPCKEYDQKIWDVGTKYHDRYFRGDM